jgi:hypothetical protein
MVLFKVDLSMTNPSSQLVYGSQKMRAVGARAIDESRGQGPSRALELPRR